MSAQRFRGVQMLRGVAAVLVVFHHFATIPPSIHNAIAGSRVPQLAAMGASGVDLFFCISGFVMMNAVSARRVHGLPWVRDFLGRRLIRIFPMYWLATTAFIVLVIVLGERNLGTTGNFVPLTKDPAFLIKSYALLPSFIPGTQTMTPFLYPGWTLSYEFLFYLVLAVAAICSGDRRVIFAIIGIEILLLLGGSRFAALSDSAVQTFLRNPVTLEFLAGAAIFVMPVRTSWGWTLIPLGILGLLATTLFPVVGGYRIVYWGLPAAVLLMGVVSAEERIGKSRVATRIGDASFSLYLTHLLVLYPLLWISIALKLKFIPVAALMAVGSIGAIAFGYLVYRYAERPMTRWLNAKFAATIRDQIPIAGSE